MAGLFATDEELEERCAGRVDLFEWFETIGIPNAPEKVEYYRSVTDIPEDAVHHSEFIVRMMDPIDSVEAYDFNMAGITLMSRTLSLLSTIPRGYAIDRVLWDATPERRAYVVRVYR